MNIKLKIIEETFSVCKVKDYSEIDLQAAFVFVGSTDEEKSLVCPTRLVPANTTEREDGWRAFRIEGILDFSLIGILAKISTCLAENDIAERISYVSFCKKENVDGQCSAILSV